jgi:ribosome biogenesis protein ERB1
LRKSKFVEGSWVREYEEFEAGYGSESSTEEVSQFVFFTGKSRWKAIRTETDCRTSSSRSSFLFPPVLTSLDGGTQNTNTIGNIPIEWYDDLPHIGYSVDGKRIMRPAKGDELDKFLATVEDPDSW